MNKFNEPYFGEIQNANINQFIWGNLYLVNMN